MLNYKISSKISSIQARSFYLVLEVLKSRVTGGSINHRLLNYIPFQDNTEKVVEYYLDRLSTSLDRLNLRHAAFCGNPVFCRSYIIRHACIAKRLVRTAKRLQLPNI